MERRGYVDLLLPTLLLVFRHLCKYTRDANRKSGKDRKWSSLPTELQDKELLCLHRYDYTRRKEAVSVNGRSRKVADKECEF